MSFLSSDTMNQSAVFGSRRSAVVVPVIRSREGCWNSFFSSLPFKGFSMWNVESVFVCGRDHCHIFKVALLMLIG
ncbi:hypothetical protein V6N12_001943 [Hibiscus sabdariffa]|uniref:Uncharacterized protein n=1 Tax=Hibiscus sabdariffa TaxID=183260 RepID=A0ABR2BRT2_9ROSI